MAPSQKIAYDDYYDDDGYDVEEDEQELSPEEQAQMRSATEEVEKALGAAVDKVTTAQIQEALWYYYYDVDKSVAYLIRKFIDPPKPSEKKAKGKKSDAGGTEGGTDGPRGTHSTGITAAGARHIIQQTKERARPSVPAHFWDDVPWFNIPSNRVTTFIEPSLPRGRLLGGGRLQALAAARKKKGDDPKVTAASKNVERLRISEDGISDVPPADNERTGENIGQTQSPDKRRKLTKDADVSTPHSITADVAIGGTGTEPALPEPAASRKSAVSLEPGTPPKPASSPKVATQSPPEKVKKASRGLTGDDEPYGSTPVEDLIKEPSAFASFLFGPPSIPRNPKRPMIMRYPVPYVAFCPNVADAFSGPSPDDEVLQAQAKGHAKAEKQAAPAGGKKDAKKEKHAEVSSTQVADNLQALKISESDRPRKPRIDVPKEYENSSKKRSATFVVVGHVDAGKSTLMGRLLLDLKRVEERTVNKYRKDADSMGKSSFALAWVFDQRSEERARGVTIDISRQTFETDTTLFTILDAPGHQDFVPNMIAGASQADFAVLVIDASSGAFESGLKGQTKEHALLIRSMGISKIIVAVNKLDTVDWSKERYDDIAQQVGGFLTAMGFQTKNISFVPMSGIGGDNVAKRSADPRASWYTGPVLIEELERSEPTARALTKPLRMSISEVYRTARSPVTVSGRIGVGCLQTGDVVLVQPSGEQATIKSLQADEADSEWAVAGQNVALHLSGIDAAHVRPGDVLCDPLKPVENVDEFTVKVMAFDVLMPDKIDVHRGRLQGAGRIVQLVALLDKATGNVVKKHPRTVKPGAVARIVVRLDQKIPLESGQRIVLRSGGETVAAGLLE